MIYTLGNAYYEEDAEFDRVTTLLRDEMIFVFGSNLAGVHGAGAARHARLHLQAQWGVGVGRTGLCYAIPTKGWEIETLPLSRIATHVTDFIDYATHAHGTQFAVTRVGCGLAGFGDEQIAPLFAGAPQNCQLPLGWREYLGLYLQR